MGVTSESHDKKKMLSLVALLSTLASVEAHTIFQTAWVNGVSQGFGVGVRYPSVSLSLPDCGIAS